MQKDFDKNLVYSFFRLHPLMTLTTVSPDGIPQNAALYVYMDEEMNCYCVTRDTTRKFRNVNTNGVAVVSTYDENVLMFGELLCHATVLTEAEEIARVTTELQKIVSSRKSVDWIPPVSQLTGDGYVFLKMKPMKATFVNYEKSSSDNPKPHSVQFEIE